VVAQVHARFATNPLLGSWGTNPRSAIRTTRHALAIDGLGFVQHVVPAAVTTRSYRYRHSVDRRAVDFLFVAQAYGGKWDENRMFTLYVPRLC
jgi:hypothetical protein